MRNEIVKKDENGIIGRDRVHIVDLNHVAGHVLDIVCDAVIVDCHVDKVDGGVSRRRDSNGREDTFYVKLAQPELE